MTDRRLRLLPDNPAATEPWEDPAIAGDFQARARQEGLEFTGLALDYLQAAGAEVLRGRHDRHDHSVDAEIAAAGRRYLVIAHGNIGTSSKRPGLRRTDTVAKVVSAVVNLHWGHDLPVIVITSHLPAPNTTCARRLASLHHNLGGTVADVVATTGDLAGYQRLQDLFDTSSTDVPVIEPRWAPWWNPDHQQTLLDLLEADHA